MYITVDPLEMDLNSKCKSPPNKILLEEIKFGLIKIFIKHSL